MGGRLEGVAWAAAIVLATGAVYEALVALEAVPIGDVPGEGAPGSSVVFVASMLGFLVACVVSIRNGLRASKTRSSVWAVLPLAGATYLVARWYSFDPYFAPTLRRYSEGGVAGDWILVVAVAAVAAAILVRVLRYAGSLVVGLVLLVEAPTVWVLPFGK